MVQSQHKEKKVWYDEAGEAVPYNRLRASEKLKESLLNKVHVKAEKLHEELALLKTLIRHSVECIRDAVAGESDGVYKEGKGNSFIYNFNGSIRLEVSISDRIEFDALLLDQCKLKLDEFLKKNINTAESFISDIILKAFETSRGKVDVKKILGLKKYTGRVKDPLYKDAMEILDRATRRPDSKTYYRIAVRNNTGGYDYIDLNFSSVD